MSGRALKQKCFELQIYAVQDLQRVRQARGIVAPEHNFGQAKAEEQTQGYTPLRQQEDRYKPISKHKKVPKN